MEPAASWLYLVTEYEPTKGSTVRGSNGRVRYPIQDVAHTHGLSEMLHGCPICEKKKEN